METAFPVLADNDYGIRAGRWRPAPAADGQRERRYRSLHRNHALLSLAKKQKAIRQIPFRRRFSFTRTQVRRDAVTGSRARCRHSRCRSASVIIATAFAACRCALPWILVPEYIWFRNVCGNQKTKKFLCASPGLLSTTKVDEPSPFGGGGNSHYDETTRKQLAQRRFLPSS
jgi:hypothetical protein